jgi:hypothetical protein
MQRHASYFCTNVVSHTIWTSSLAIQLGRVADKHPCSHLTGPLLSQAVPWITPQQPPSASAGSKVCLTGALLCSALIGCLQEVWRTPVQKPT